MLYTNHQLNYGEAVSRIVFWANKLQSGRDERALGALKLLVDVLERNRDNL